MIDTGPAREEAFYDAGRPDVGCEWFNPSRWGLSGAFGVVGEERFESAIVSVAIPSPEIDRVPATETGGAVRPQGSEASLHRFQAAGVSQPLKQEAQIDVKLREIHAESAAKEGQVESRTEESQIGRASCRERV